jgi:dipeptide transport system ATP-binding protein
VGVEPLTTTSPPPQASNAVTPLLRATDLARHYSVRRGLLQPRLTVRALDGVSFSLQASQTLGVVGESGCGKSTLARQLVMIERPTRGALLLQGQDMAHADAATLRRLRPQVQMVFQNPYASLNPRRTVRATLDEPLLLTTALSAPERAGKVAAMAARVGLKPEHLGRYPHMFSGGQRQRIAIARAMMTGPAVVVADEPTSALDVSIQAQILNLFMDLQDEYGTGFVFISHNLAVVEHVAHEVMVMYFGRVVEQGPKARIFGAPLHPYTQALMSATPTLHRDGRRQRIPIHGEPPSPLNPPSGCAFRSRCAHAVARCADEAPALREVGGQQVACHVV